MRKTVRPSPHRFTQYITGTPNIKIYLIKLLGPMRRKDIIQLNLIQVNKYLLNKLPENPENFTTFQRFLPILYDPG